MLRNSNSQESLSQTKSPTKSSHQDSLQLCQQVRHTLDLAAQTLPRCDFAPVFERAMQALISRAELQSPHNQQILLSGVKQSLSLYGGSRQVNVRTLLLQILSELNCNLLDSVPVKLEKAKHIVLHSQVEYLLPKIFLLQQRYWNEQQNSHKANKALRKSISINEDNLAQSLTATQDVRKEVVDHAIVAYYEQFKILKSERPSQALQILMKAFHVAQNNYGKDSKVAQRLLQTLKEQQRIINGLQRLSVKSRAVTDILDYSNRKNYHTTAFYSWQDEKIVVQLFRTKGKDNQIISESSYDIKLDINKIKLLKSNEWLTIQRGQIVILEEELLRLLGTGNQGLQKQPINSIGPVLNIANKKENYLSSSEDDEEFFARHGGFGKLIFERAQSSRKFKETQ